MQIDPIGSSTSVAIPISNRVGQSQEGIIERRPPIKENRHEEKAHVEERKFSEEDVIGVIQRANKDFVVYDRKFEFSIHEKTKQIMIKVIDAVTDEVIRELPPEKVLDMVAAMWEVAGIIVDRKI